MRARQLGMSLVELLVAVAIGLIGILIITQAYLVGDNFNRATLGEGGAQTNGLVSLYTIERDARNAGYGFNNSAALGCGNIFWYYDPNYSANTPPGGSLPNITLAPLVITHDLVTPANPDKISFMYSSEGERMMPTTVSSFNSKSSEVSVDGTDGFKIGDLVLMVNAGGCTLGKITQVQGVAQKLQLNPGVSAPFNPPAWGNFPTSYASGDSILNLGNPTVRTYQIGSGKLQTIDALFTTGAATSVDLVDSIVDLRALYGKDTNADNVVDRYDYTTPTTSAEWLQVTSAKIAVLARIGNYEKKSVGASECDATTVVPAWSGSAVSGPITTANPFLAISVASGSEDRCYRYRVFETTVPLRNMIWRP
jgi:type IV pilus assembly protein PilW